MKRGISIVSLVVIISVMLVLVSVITITGMNISNTSKEIEFASEIKMIQDCVNSYRTSNEGEFPISEVITIDLTKASDDVKKQFVDNNEDFLDNRVTLNKIDCTKLKINSLVRGNSNVNDDIYALSPKTGIVYYVKGLKIGGTTYYTLTDKLRRLLEYNSKSDEILTNDGIIVKKSMNEWTNKSLFVSVKVPKDYSNIVVKVEGNILNVDNNILNEDYYIYSYDVQNNCEIEVEYINKENLKRLFKYSVMNIDKQKPNIEVNKITKSNIDKKIFEVKCNDLGSGVKIIKYDTDRIDDTETGKIYFNNNGIEIKDNLVEIENNIPYITLYVEDNVGNYKLLIVEV